MGGVQRKFLGGGPRRNQSPKTGRESLMPMANDEPARGPGPSRLIATKARECDNRICCTSFGSNAVESPSLEDIERARSEGSPEKSVAEGEGELICCWKEGRKVVVC